jgi:flagellar basal body-associated protein FliL
MNNMGVYNPGPKKKNIKVIALAAVCIILAAGLVGVTAIYLSSGNTADLKAQIADKDAAISSLQANNTALQNQLNQIPSTSIYTSQIDSLKAQLSDLNETANTYYNIALMKSSGALISQQTVTQDANTSTQVFSDDIFYAGYVIVQATASANTTYVEVSYTAGGTNFDYSQVVGTSGSAMFPVLPSTLQINIGNTNQTTANAATVSATYYY